MAKDVAIFILSHIEKIRNSTECKQPCHLTVYEINKSEYGLIKGRFNLLIEN